MSEIGRISVKELTRITSLFETLPGATAAFARPMSHGTWLNMYICNMGVDVGNGDVNVGGRNGPYSEACS